MKYRDIQPGMRVRVRQWDDMASEGTVLPDRIFAGDDKHRPAERNCFIRPMMEGLCGMEFTVTSFGYGASPAALNGHDFRKANESSMWVIEPWMVEPVYEEEISAPESFDLSELLAPNPDANGGVGT